MFIIVTINHAIYKDEKIIGKRLQAKEGDVYKRQDMQATHRITEPLAKGISFCSLPPTVLPTDLFLNMRFDMRVRYCEIIPPLSNMSFEIVCNSCSICRSSAILFLKPIED